MKESFINWCKGVIYLIGICILAWIILSWIDVAAHNLTTESYWRYNLFTILSVL